MSRIEHPGLVAREDFQAGQRGYFEQAYQLADGLVMRARFTPVQDQPAIADQVNLPTAPSNYLIHVSRSLVDAAGQVLTVGGRALVRDATSHKWMATGPAPFDAEAWLDEKALEGADDLVAAWRTYSANAFLLPPVAAG